MHVVVIGAGTVGTNIASHLTRDRHDVVVIDMNEAKLAELEDHTDVQTLVGDGCDPHFLQRILEDQSSDLLLAVTDEDNTNLIIAYSAKRLGIPRVVARVRKRFYLESGDVNFREPLGIDLLLSPEILSALELARVVENPAALAIANFAQGRVQVRIVMLSPFSNYATKAIRELNLPPGVLIAFLRRGKQIVIPGGEDRLETGDHVALIGFPSVIDDLHPVFDTEQDTRSARSLRVAIAGAGETGLFLAELLELREHRVTIIDLDRRRCELASQRLQNARVLHGDCTNIQFLREEQIERVDYFIAATGDDESNVMAALLARELHVGKTACLIDRPDYARVVEMVGIDVAVSPRIVAANRLMTLVRQGRIRSVTLLEEGAVQLTEYQALHKSQIVGQPLKEVALPEATLMGALVRGSEVVIPRGDDIIRPGDCVITVAASQASEELDRLFREEEES